MALALALRLIADQETARDPVQESWLQVYLSLETLRDETRFRSWFYGIVLNVCRSFQSARTRNDLSLDALKDATPFLVLAPFGVFADPQELLEQKELHQAMLEALQVLSPKNRAVALLFYYEDASLQEIATKLHLSLAAVKGRLHKGRIQLQRHLMTDYPELERHLPEKRGMSLQGPDLGDPVGIEFVADLLQAMGGNGRGGAHRSPGRTHSVREGALEEPERLERNQSSSQ